MRPTILLAALPALLIAQETTTTLKDQKALAVTIYNDNLALVKDQREVRLPKGEPGLAFQEVSAQIRPETALLRNLTAPKDFWMSEQNFDFDLLTPQKLLEKYVGDKVTVVQRPTRTAPGPGRSTRRPRCWPPTAAWYCSSPTASRPACLAASSIPRVPGNLRARPTLVISLNTGADKAQNWN